MKINFGLNVRQKLQGKERPVIWDSDQVVNGHILMVGMSGSGKTYTLRRMIQQMQETASHRIRFHVFDVHGDMALPNESSVMFSEQTQYGINPLRLNPDPHFGGIRKRIQNFIGTMSQTNTLGVKQESVIRNILSDLYQWRGFKHDTPQTWVETGQRTYPTMEDAYRLAHYLLKTRFLGSNQTALKNLEDVNRKARAIQRKRKEALKEDDPDGKAMEALESAKEKAIETYAKYVASIRTGTELNDILRYSSIDVLNSVVERLENLKATGIFKDKQPPFDPSTSIWRYDLKALDRREQVLFVLFKLEEMFNEARQRGEQTQIRDVIVLDEARIYTDDKPENPINTISTEGRKFGLSLICASQTPTHFTENFIASVATKIILGIDQMYWEGSIKKMGISKEQLKWVTPRKGCVVQIKAPGQTRNDWQGAIFH